MGKRGVILIVKTAVGLSVAITALLCAAYLSGITVMAQLDVLLLTGGLLLLMFLYRKGRKGGFCSFSELVRAGLLMTVIASAISAIVFTLFLASHPGLVAGLENNLVSSKQMKALPPNDHQFVGSVASIFFSPVFMGILRFAGSMTKGAILSIILALVLSKTPPREQKEETMQQQVR